MPVNFKYVLAGAADRFSEIQAENRAYVKDMQSKYRAYLAESGLEKLQKLREGRAASLANIRKAQNFGFTKEAAILLENSGQLEAELENLSKLKISEINKANIQRISETITSRVTPEYQEKVLTEFLKRGSLEDLSDIEDRFVKSIMNVADGSMDKATKIFSEIPSSSSSTIEPFNVSFRGAENLTISEQNTLDTLVEKEIIENFGNQFEIDPRTGQSRYIGDDAAYVNKLMNEMKEQYRAARNNPEFLGDPQSVITSAGEQIREQLKNQTPVLDVNINPTFTPQPSAPRTGDEFEENYLFQ
jgi:hypothetical protein